MCSSPNTDRRHHRRGLLPDPTFQLPLHLDSYGQGVGSLAGSSFNCGIMRVSSILTLGDKTGGGYPDTDAPGNDIPYCLYEARHPSIDTYRKSDGGNTVRLQVNC